MFYVYRVKTLGFEGGCFCDRSIRISFNDLWDCAGLLDGKKFDCNSSIGADGIEDSDT